jgi:type I restriction enzyme S subunit
VIPKLDEQNRISSILLESDRKLRAEKHRGQTLGVLKRGLMQMLLTGKVRVKVN